MMSSDRTRTSIARVIEQQWQSSPGHDAVHAAGRWWRSTEIERESRRIVTALAELGVQIGAVVAVLLPRGIDQLLAILAVHRLGAVCLPLDIEAPLERLRHCLDQSGACRLIGDRAQWHSLDPEAARRVEDSCHFIDILDLRRSREGAPVQAPLLGDDAAFCVLYTSGSTGRPKGVALSQRNVLNCLQWMQQQHPLGGDEVVLHKTPIGFDVSMYELFWPLMAGARIVIADEHGHKDAAYLAELIQHHGITDAHFVPAMLAAFSDQAETPACASLKRIYASGEALPWALVRRLGDMLPQARIYNWYGPTEGGVVSHQACDGDQRDGFVPIGRAVANTSLHVLDDDLRPLPPGSDGELYIGGAQVALGYVNQPELTAQRFVQHARFGRLYRSGDFVCERADGGLEYRGRRDQQVKLRGVRVELGEIESALLAYAGVTAAAAGVRDLHGQPSLLAWYQTRIAIDVSALRAFLEQRLPAAMLPQHFIAIDSLPQLSSGKIDRSALPLRVTPAPRQRPLVAAVGDLQQRLLAIWQNVLKLDAIGVEDRFFEAGGNSLQAVELMGQLRRALGQRVPLIRFFEAPTIRALATLLERDYAAALAHWLGNEVPGRHHAPVDAVAAKPKALAAGKAIAIVGMSCRVPGAEDLDAFWQQIANGREGLRDFTDEELIAAGVSAADIADPGYVRRGGAIDEPYGFDAAFFGYSPREAELTDPQQRVLLEAAWHALEDAGIAAGRGERIGVYVGLARNQYFDRQLASYEDLRLEDPGFQVLLGNDKDYAATRIAYKLDLRGPALSLQTACSSSGVAVHLACQALRQNDCDAAIVGGVRLNLPHRAGYRHVDGGPQAIDGRVRPFDAAASGMVLSSGVACLVLKPLSRAQADGDRIYALIKGSAINNDGAAKIGYTAPSLQGQLAVIRAALDSAGVEPQSVGYVEAHGTGTPLGDPIEVAALSGAYEQADHIALGSVKGNIGHLDAGAGAIGLIKTALALKHRQLPPSIHFDTPNPECDFDRTPFFVNTELLAWHSPTPRRAAVSAFGFGGTNFHGVLEQAPEPMASPAARQHQVLRLSARDDQALSRLASRLAAHLKQQPELALADVAYTLDVGRARQARRTAIVATDTADAVAQLERFATAGSTSADPSLVFMFPGQGAQHVDMGRDLYETEPLFRELIDECADRLTSSLAVDLRSILYPQHSDREAAEQLMRTTEYAQPAIFAVSYASARLWQSWGLQPDALVGHSLGEFVAATLAGVFTLDDALKLIAQRGRLMQSVARGSMLAVHLSEADVQPYLGDNVALAAINSPQQLVLAGPDAALAGVAEKLRAHGIASSVLHTSHAFHSSMMAEIVEPFAGFVAGTRRGHARLALMSTLSGGWSTPEDLREPHHWARQLREPVRFGPAIHALLAQPGRVFLEVGPGQSLSTAVRQAMQPENQATVLSSMPHATQAASAHAHLMRTVATLFVAGVELEPAKFYAGEHRLKVSLPAYPFQRQRYFIEAADRAGIAAPPPAIALVADDVPEAMAAVAATAGESDDLSSRLLRLLAQLTGRVFTDEHREHSFLELGMDSLTLTQLASKLRREFKVEVRFRKLLEEYGSIHLLTAYLREQGASAAVVVPLHHNAAPAAATGGATASFGAGTRIRREYLGGFTSRQAAAVDALAKRYLARTGRSREYAAAHRAVLADPRTVSGFRPETKELVYPIVVDRSEGSYLWDLDGNGYVDATCGFGSMFFGHRARFVSDAIAAQLKIGWEIGPQTPLAGECARLFSQATGLARVAFCNTGSEAVLAAVRLARTVTGKSLIVSFTGDYHGIQDEVLARAGIGGRSIPAAPGIPAESVANTLILDYGDPDALRVIRERADEIAGVLIEPVQSRRPDFQPREFLQQLRTLTYEADIAFIMDEVITGFRSGLRGAQGYYGVDADIAIYGKVFGGGMPVGAVAGIPRYLDALDGGAWQYGDASVPEIGVTYFAGTFVRHPLALAAVRASLQALLEHPEWPDELSATTARMVDAINDDCAVAGAPLHLLRHASLWKPQYEFEQRNGDLLFFYLRERGVHIWEGRPCFLSLAHSEADCQQIIDAFRYAVTQMQEGDLFDLPAAGITALRSRSPATRRPALANLSALTGSQSEIWVASAYDPDLNRAYNEGIAVHMSGALDVDALERALKQLIERHDSLRAVFSPDGRWMKVLEAMPLQIDHSDLTGEASIAAATAHFMNQSMDLATGPLLRCALIRSAAQEHRLLLLAHHIVCDGWSMAQLLVELGALYSAGIDGRPAALPEAPRYTEYAEIEHRFMRSPEAAAQIDWWRRQLAEPPVPVELPLDHARPSQRRFAAAREDRRLPAELTGELRRIAAAQGNSLVMTLLAVFAAQLHRLTGVQDLVIGLAAAGQALHERPQQIGHCVNFLPLRLRPNGETTLGALLKQTRQTVLDAYDHQGISFGELLPRLDIARDDSRPPLISLAFNLDLRDDDIRHSGLSVRYETLARQYETFEMFLNVVDDGRELALECSYNRELFDAASIRRRLGEYEQLLGVVATHLERPLRDLPLMSSAERRRLLHEFNPPSAPIAALTLHDAIAEQARARPDAIAIQCADRQLDYAALVARAEQIAAALQTIGVGTGDFVGVSLTRSVDLPAALIAVMRCGAAYLPLDPELPTQRLQFMAHDASIKALIHEAATVAAIAGIEARRLNIGEIGELGGGGTVFKPLAVDAGAPAYAIYTSGSTGQPKAVVAHHRGVSNCLAGTRERIGIGPGDALLAIATYAFDAAVLELFLPLVYGARLVLATGEQTGDGRQLADAIERHRITRIFTAPAAWRLLLASGWGGRRGLVACSWAEPLSRELAGSLLPRVDQLWNLYGPTETTVWTLGARIVDADDTITIGSPIANTRAYVLDEHRSPLPVGVVGELYIGGAGVTLGYLNRAELQAERFCEHPEFGALYRSGDLARWTNDGEIVCLGRADHQIKLRGFRIELGEIEARLQAHAHITSAACGVVERSADDPRLVAWVQPAAHAAIDAIDAAELRRHLRTMLPGYMVPQHFVVLDELPRLSNGKLDRCRLPSPFGIETAAARAPDSDSEQRVAALWREVLGDAAFGADERFLDVGGHSLLAVQMAARLQTELGVKLSLREAMTGTLAQIAAACDAQQASLRPTAAAASNDPASNDPVIHQTRAPAQRRWAWPRWLQ
ncbi:MAG: glutamate-semialdehyde -aminomutase [Hydrocarboniphaga sp.]|uniref:non-ribosomal peptide synthetase/type I polyketide synthase n=1 Tax=Hydrocarboniphaga sp. TaxID=2033016 RepID=UPI00260699EE|nr:non-ribosomal peptide synthetase/type I polyketide synthase [Hydrocarboniphaga sp.]MDB5969250.1 glutamate-semialdehyde -aminomutase [Hydrocarboniphaga sp.]